MYLVDGLVKIQENVHISLKMDINTYVSPLLTTYVHFAITIRFKIGSNNPSKI